MLEVTHILKVCTAVVERISVDVMRDHIIGGLCNNSVHTDKVDPAISDNLRTGIPSATGLFGIPVEPAKLQKKAGVK